MLEKYLTDPAAVERRRAGLFGAHLESFTVVVSELGYCRSTVRLQLRLLDDLERWLKRRHQTLIDLDEGTANQFLEKQRRKGWLRRGDGQTIRRFLAHLRDKGVVACQESTIDESPVTMLRKRYEDYVRKERGLCSATFTRYWVFVRDFIVERFGHGPICVRELIPDDVSHFLLRHARSGSTAAAKLMVPALRSFFRFLFQHGETENDLAGAVPTVPTWRLKEVPRHLKPEEVERVIEACDLSRPVGCRDQAIILLLARLGLRAGEVIALELDDIHWRAGVITVRGKGSYHDRLPLPADVGKALATYLRQHRPQCRTRRVFIRSKAPLRGFAHPSSISSIVCHALKRAGLQSEFKGAHILRHSLATGMLHRGASMAEIGELLRHRASNTTEIYAKVDIRGLRSLALPWPWEGGEQ